jgi:hypothetical protein
MIIPIESRGRSVTKKEFYARVGPLMVHPSPKGKYDPETGYLSVWEMQDGSRKVIGYSDGGTPFLKHRYWLTA